MALKRRSPNDLEFHKYPVGRAIKDINKIGRWTKTESERERGYLKTARQITQEELDRMIAIAKREKDLGMMEYCKDYKGNHMAEINRFLFDTRLQPRERLCYRYIANPTQCKGKLRDKTVISAEYIGIKSYDLYVNYEFKKNFRTQEELIEYIKKLIGYRN